MCSTAVKCLVVGDTTVGKTCLVMRYKYNIWLDKYIPTGVEPHDQMKMFVNEEKIPIIVYDIGGSEDYDRMRVLTYPDICLVCFSVVDPVSYENVKRKWYPMVSDCFRNSPLILLVGTKSDLKTDSEIIGKLAENNLKLMTREDGLRLQHEIKAVNYIECSALTQNNTTLIFEEAIQVVLSYRNRQRILKRVFC